MSTPTQERVAPCPFCGLSQTSPTHDGEFARGDAPQSFAIQCSDFEDCGAIGPFKRTKSLAIAAWNTRAPRQED